VIGDNYLETCQGFMTFGPGATYAPGGGGDPAVTGYLVLTWLGIAVMVVVLIAWAAYENRRLLNYVRTLGRS
jgi:hypothetical protein